MTWTLDGLVAALRLERPINHEQIAGLLAPVSSPEHELVLSFVLLQNSVAATALANARGLRVQAAQGPRDYCTRDVIALVRNGHPTVPTGLLDLARQGLPTHWYKAARTSLMGRTGCVAHLERPAPRSWDKG